MKGVNPENTFKLSPADISAAILAGGDARRFGGKVKAKLLLGDEMIIVRIIKTLRKIFDEIIIVTNEPMEYSDLTGCLITSDHFPGCGPLAGIHAAMKRSSRKAVFVVAGDMPFLDEKLIRDQIAYATSHPSYAVIPEINGMREPLHGIYMKAIEEKLERNLVGGKQLALTDLIDSIETSFFRPDGNEEVKRVFININTPGDIEKYK
jgi:molybdopterin-guanine dinucleotide biosynthesis protein A